MTEEHRIVLDLIDAGYVARHKVGRHNHYTVRLDRHLRHPLEAVTSTCAGGLYAWLMSSVGVASRAPSVNTDQLRSASTS
jgi:hypothetical protein